MENDSKHLPLCPITRTALIIGSRWTAQILHFLMEEDAARFQDIQTALGSITPAVLSNRLKMLDDAGIILRTVENTRPPHAVYSLTEKGKEMRGIIGAMRDWGKRYPAD